MEVVRRDWTALAHEVQRELYRRLFAGEPVEAYLRQVIGEVAAGRRGRPSRVPQDVAQGRTRVPGAAAPRRGSPQTRRGKPRRRRARNLHAAGGDRLRDHRGRTGAGRRLFTGRSTTSTTSNVRSGPSRNRCWPPCTATSARYAATNASSSCSDDARAMAVSQRNGLTTRRPSLVSTKCIAFVQRGPLQVVGCAQSASAGMYGLQGLVLKSAQAVEPALGSPAFDQVHQVGSHQRRNRSTELGCLDPGPDDRSLRRPKP